MEPRNAGRPALDQELRRVLTVIRQVFGPSARVIIVEDNPHPGHDVPPTGRAGGRPADGGDP